ncbi:MAG: hypothetical protein GF364_04885 [Candidatus Lokiarchaeota archaeon]|nr:hypothetical protein [Candidatus Lokiarchaeota archaeon]
MTAKANVNPGDVFEGVLKNVKFTCNSPFGEQWSTIQLGNNKMVAIATWINYSATAKNSPRVGDRVRVTVGSPKSSWFGRGKVYCGPCALNIIKIS